MGRLYGVLNVKIGLRKWPKRAILAVFWTFFKGPMREFAQTLLKCSFSHARFTGMIGSDVLFFRGLAQKETRSVGVKLRESHLPTPSGNGGRVYAT